MISLNLAAEKIEAGKIVGLLNGRMEFGPQILAIVVS